MGPAQKILSMTVISLLLPAGQCPVFAQLPPGAEKATESPRRTIQKKIEEELERVPQKVPEISEEEPQLQEGERFFIKEITLTGCETVSCGEFDAVLREYESREVTLGELDQLCKKVEREYLKKGIIAACILPPQELSRGTVTLRIVEAKLGSVEIRDHRHFRESRLQWYWRSKRGEVLRYDQLYRDLQLMNKNPDRTVSATLHAGEEPETTDVILEAETEFPVHVTSSFNNEGASSTGVYQKGAGARHNNFLGLDDTLLAGYLFGRHFDGKYVYHSLPVSNFGTTLLYGHSYSKSFPKKEFAPLQITSRARNTTVSLRQDLFSREKYLGEAYLTFDAKDKTVTQIAGTANRDRLRIFRLGASFLARGAQSITRISPEFSQGVNGFGARRRSALSSRGGENTFSKANIGLTHSRLLPWDSEGRVQFEGQVATTTLVPQEAFSLGGIDSVRGYPAQDFLADDAFQSNVEVFFPAFFIPARLKLPGAESTLREDTAPLVFFDYGWGARRSYSPAEQGDAHLIGVGAGLRLRLFNRALLRLEWGFPVGEDTISEDGNSRFHFSIDFET
ncbi:MAG: BamA/TamA family outer membrane protein [Candidatus Omnitrophica bacterium]|nr:BamA/TamA family outer membrane protein [Candidatus Omnitrophota bacterium]